MILAAALAATQAVVLWSLWVRRHTWRSRWDVSATLCLTFQGAALFLLSPWSHFIRLHPWTGLWNIRDFVAHCLFVAAAAAVVHYALIRVTRDRDQQLYCDRALMFPSVLGVALMLAFFTHSNLSRADHAPDVLAVFPNVWGRCYWLTLSLTLGWLMGYGIFLLWRIREDPRQRRQANTYLVALSLGMLAVAARVVTAVHPELNPRGLVAWPCCCVGVMIYAVAFARAWKVRQRELVVRRV